MSKGMKWILVGLSAWALFLMAAIGSREVQPTIPRVHEKIQTPEVSKEVKPRKIPTPARPATAYDGDVIVLPSSGVCASSEDALSEIVKWAVRKDREEFALTIVRTGSSIVEAGATVKILDRGFMQSKIRVLKTGAECWVVSEALQR